MLYQNVNESLRHCFLSPKISSNIFFQIPEKCADFKINPQCGIAEENLTLLAMFAKTTFLHQNVSLLCTVKQMCGIWLLFCTKENTILFHKIEMLLKFEKFDKCSNKIIAAQVF